jgi:hypothetical protein
MLSDSSAAAKPKLLDSAVIVAVELKRPVFRSKLAQMPTRLARRLILSESIVQIGGKMVGVRFVGLAAIVEIYRLIEWNTLRRILFLQPNVVPVISLRTMNKNTSPLWAASKNLHE